MHSIEDPTEFSLPNNLTMETLFPYPDHLFRAVFGKGLDLSRDTPRWFELSADGNHFDRVTSLVLLQYFTQTLGIPRGIEALINTIVFELYITTEGELVRGSDLRAARKSFQERLNRKYSQYGDQDRTGIIATIGALCMEFELEEVIPHFTRETRMNSTVAHLASQGVLVPFAYEGVNEPGTLPKQWCCPAIFFLEKLHTEKTQFLSNVLGILDESHQG